MPCTSSLGKHVPSRVSRQLFFAECQVGTRQRWLCWQLFTKRPLPSVALGKAFAECNMGFADCPRHSAKNLIPEVLSLTHCMQACATPTLVASPISPPQSPALARLELVPAPWHGSPAPRHVAQVFKSVNLIHAITNCTMVRTTFAIHQLFQTMPL